MEGIATQVQVGRPDPVLARDATQKKKGWSKDSNVTNGTLTSCSRRASKTGSGQGEPPVRHLSGRCQNALPVLRPRTISPNGNTFADSQLAWGAQADADGPLRECGGNAVPPSVDHSSSQSRVGTSRNPLANARDTRITGPVGTAISKRKGANSGRFGPASNVPRSALQQERPARTIWRESFALAS